MNGVEALRRLQDPARAPIDIVLIDLHMPQMDGLEATRRIQVVPSLSAVQLIGMTAAALAEDHEQCLTAGVVDDVSKPFKVSSGCSRRSCTGAAVRGRFRR